ncbi:Succinate--CoA ligase (ADP-forming) [Stanieria cyanosphaera PCC 7437]|uniref:Succinate--CoA ligase (ADP-forming) n=1 Tax=Stanieria cyanosphaera (strain ATCC 29371 / PCC 7437) TaxID=111780 RepID=K9XWR6_STAC7|nr:ATP-grasp domain-containing protein [Stanieria cyanosphaera]AFZ36526.1 Succinate--CoA ligase (ADP-forming) [Stanieria cyanosphaera PCC 7437]
MELLEYQAKELFREVGIPVLPSQKIAEPRELKKLQIPYPVVLKSQVKVGGRGKAGGIRFVANTIDAIAAARAIFNLSILGEYPKFILAEAQFNAEQEFFLAVVLDYDLQCPVLLGSATGGMNVELLLENLQKVVVENNFSSFLARRLAVKMGLKSHLLQSVSDVIEKMYRLFQEKDLELIEINPLGVNASGQLMALDGKITVNDYAWARHQELTALNSVNQVSEIPDSTQPQWSWYDDKGKVAIICNHPDLALLTWDLVAQSKGKPACCAVISEVNSVLTASEQLHQVLAQLPDLKGLKVILINVLTDQATEQELIEAIAEYLEIIIEPQSKSTGEERQLVANGALVRSRPTSVNKSFVNRKPLSSVKFVLRFLSSKLDWFPETESEQQVYCAENLEEAVAQAISLVKSK